jgi:hypothetical protein
MSMNSATLPRFDLYGQIHKALRLGMADTLARFGSLDAGDAGQRLEAIAQLRALLDLCRAHVEKEEHHVHPVIEARCTGRSLRVAAEHVEHLAAIDALEAEAVAFQCAPDAAAAFRLYRHLALFVAENLEHMEVEETVHNAALWSAYTDAELQQVHVAIVSAIDPDAMAQALHWMLPALNPDERAELLLGLRASAPAAAFEGALQMARQRLGAGDCARLERALDLSAPTA